MSVTRRNGCADPMGAPPWGRRWSDSWPGTEIKVRQISTSRQSWRRSSWVFLQVSVAEDARFELARGGPNTLSNNAYQRSPRSAIVRDLPERDWGGRW